MISFARRGRHRSPSDRGRGVAVGEAAEVQGAAEGDVDVAVGLDDGGGDVGGTVDGQADGGLNWAPAAIVGQARVHALIRWGDVDDLERREALMMSSSQMNASINEE